MKYVRPTLEELRQHRSTLRQYAVENLDLGDYHSVRGACVDLEVLETQIDLMEHYEKLLKDAETIDFPGYEDEK